MFADVADKNIKLLTLDREDRIYTIFDYRIVRLSKQPSVHLNASTKGGGIILFNKPAGPYPTGTEVQLTAKSETDWQFLHWTNSITGNQNPVKVTLNQDLNVEAVFGAPLTLEVNGEGTYYQAPIKSLYAYGEIIDEGFTPSENYKWLRWVDGIREAYRKYRFISPVLAGLVLQGSNVYTLQTRIEENLPGRILLEPQKEAYGFRERVTMTVQPDPGFFFSRWRIPILRTQELWK